MLAEDLKKTSGKELPYAHDALGRLTFAKNFLKLIERIPSGVIAIDGEWGVGKSWLGKEMKADIDQQKQIGTIWIDVFDADWDDDPAMSLIAEIASQLSPEDKETFVEKVSPYLAKLLPTAAKAAIKTAGNYIGVDKDVLDEISDLGKSSTEIFIKKHLTNAAEKKKNLCDIKDLLTQTIGIQHKKLVVFVDELDRCSPIYAVRFLERLKHLFELQGVIYVLLWNRQQVQKAVESFYGVGSNGQMYLDRFVDYPLHLPVSQTRTDQLPLTELVNSIVKDEASSHQIALYENAHLITIIASILRLTAREAKRISAWWTLSPNRPFPLLETWLLGIKVKHPDLFAGLRKGDRDAHKNAADLLTTYQITPEADGQHIQDLVNLHTRFATGDFTSLKHEFIRHFIPVHGKLETAFTAAFRRLEHDFG